MPSLNSTEHRCSWCSHPLVSHLEARNLVTGRRKSVSGIPPSRIKAYRYFPGVSAGILKRTNIETAFSSPFSGAWPRPSLMWQFWQPLVLNNGRLIHHAHRLMMAQVPKGFLKLYLRWNQASLLRISKLAAGREKRSRPLSLLWFCHQVGFMGV